MTANESSPKPSAENLERNVAEHVRSLAGVEMSEDASATLALAMAVTAVSIRAGELAGEVRDLRKATLAAAALK